MANNVNCKEMRFVIRNLVDVDDVSLATAPEIPFDDSLAVGPETSCLLELRRYFPKAEGMMQHNYGRYFPQ